MFSRSVVQVGPRMFGAVIRGRLNARDVCGLTQPMEAFTI